jgi:putative transposase
VKELQNIQHVFNDSTGKIRVMPFDQAGFGRISEPSYCWCFPGFRPTVPCHKIREYMYAYGAVDPVSGDDFFLVLPKCNTDYMEVFLQKMSEEFPNDYIILLADRASWHTSEKLQIPENIEFFFIPPATPEMNPIEQIWKEIRKEGFKNQSFSTLEKVVDRLCETINNLAKETVKSITGRDWILECF